MAGSTINQSPVQGLTTRFNAYNLFGVQPMTTSTGDTLAKAYQANAEKQITRQQRHIADQAQVKIDAAKREMARWQPITTGVANAQNTIQQAQTQVRNLDKILFNMLGALNQPANGDWTSQAARFDSMLGALNNIANSDDPSNLLGSRQRGNTYKPNEITYQASPDPRDQVTVYGTFAGSDYKIAMADGTFWMPSHSQTIQQYAQYPNATIGYPQGTGSGATKLDAAFDPNALAFSTGNLVNNPQSYTGSLQRTGLGVLQSWLYDGLTTTDGRARALQDIQAARKSLQNIGQSLDAAQTQATNDLAVAQQQVDDQTKLMTQLSTDANKEVQTYVAKIQSQVQAQLTAAINVGATPAVQMVRVGGKIGQLFDLMT